MDLAHAEAVRDHRIAAILGISHDVSRIEKLWASQAANGALRLIRAQNPDPELWLMEPLPGDSLGVAALSRGGVERISEQAQLFGEGDDELVSCDVVADDEYREDGHVQTRPDLPKENERQLKLHGSTELGVVPL